jgi:16S rRNA (uracil1498-N3)-methyltransferase
MPRILLHHEAAESAAASKEFELDYETAKKVARVLRMSEGETFIGFDGRGKEWDCVIVSTQGQGKRPYVRAVALSERAGQAPLPLYLCVAQALPKGEKIDFVLQKGTELGVAEFWPFEAGRSVTRLFIEEDGERAGNRAARWRKIVESASAQCGRADVPEVRSASDFATVASEAVSAGRCFMLDEAKDAKPLREILEEEPLERADGIEFASDAPHIILLVGPEGGWTAEERDWAQRYGVESVSLGTRILRTETAALVAASILLWESGGLS